MVFPESAVVRTDEDPGTVESWFAPAKDKTYMEFEGGYHELLNDECRAEVRELILGWLRGHTL